MEAYSGNNNTDPDQPEEEPILPDKQRTTCPACGESGLSVDDDDNVIACPACGGDGYLES
jgi:DnaJ-class molecular chaperone